MSEPILNDISHRRFNLLRGSWVLVSPHRNKRPWQGLQESPSKTTLPEYDEKCYLCPGNTRAQGQQNPKFDRTFVFVNDFSAVKEEQTEYHPERKEGSVATRLLKAESVTGKCYVITFSPSHHLTLADMTPAQIVPIIETWTNLYTAHLNPQSTLAQVASASTVPPLGQTDLAKPNAQYRYMQIFENKGTTMGCSNPHPHGQIWTTTSLPEEPSLEMEQLRKYKLEQGGAHLLVDYAELESKEKERTVFENRSFWAGCPYWAVWPFEVMIVSKQHKRALVDFDEKEREELAEAIAEITKRYDNLFETQFPYSMGLHQAPLDGSEDEIEASHFHIHFFPPLLRSATVRKFQVGYEMLAEPQRDITPEQAAERLRNCGGELYRKKL
ncbi:galactose-1-phosphate uridylyltransferase [Lindgomyces ingoldianus]|uniref:Galactose-1-phosphate uridylyltransferase n=1 Tax=Lindgomyces ingoldianus TaxID=673940 RepID=A0ACB6R8R9_9PLEO|nr:galactose-1-phosphate uridylyltransferase [Lindgomyces ingoldianus]KAF2475713.1 galactose-1-phosphate uridylyltransferase [Lindgomyces ingoldianus]